MTTTVKVEAHLSSEKEVRVSINTENTGEVYILQDGENGEYYVYDDREISVKEVVKDYPQETNGPAKTE